MIRAPLVFCLVLAGCVGGAGEDPSPRDRRTPQAIQLEPDAGGLAVVGSGGRRIDFGRAPSGVFSVLERELGPGRALGLTDCPAGIRQQLAWGDLVLTFTDERFVGWRGANGSAGQVCGRMA